MPPPERRVRARLVVAALAVASILALAAGALLRERLAGPVARPNVVLVVADDMRFDDLRALPTVVELARRGVTFERAFATTPLCCPSRASLLTGRYARNHGVRANEPPNGGFQAFDDRSTLATWLRDAGVRTGLVGRYLNEYAARYVPPGWDSWFAIWHSQEDKGLYYRYKATNDGNEETYGSREGHYSGRVLERQAIRFLEGDRERPFLLWLAPRAPHSPPTPDERDRNTYQDLRLDLSPAFDEEDVSDKPGAIRAQPRFDADEKARLIRFRQRQYQSLLSLDRTIGELVQALRADGRLDRTWFIVTSDNGLTVGEHRLPPGKSCVYEECARVPLVVIPPGGLAEGRTVDRLVANIDLAPTIAEIVGVKPGGPVDGRSLVPLVRGESPPWRDALVLEQWGNPDSYSAFAAVRTEDRKYVAHETGEEELYDLAEDPHELVNLAAEPSREGEKAALAERLRALLGGPARVATAP